MIMGLAQVPVTTLMSQWSISCDSVDHMLHDSSCLLSLRIDRKEYQIERPGCPPTDTRNLTHLSRANRSERLCCNCCQPFPDSKSPCAKQRHSTCQGRVNLRI